MHPMHKNEGSGRKRARGVLNRAGYKGGGHVTAKEAVHAHEKHDHPGKPRTKFANGGKVMGTKGSPRLDKRPRGASQASMTKSFPENRLNEGIHNVPNAYARGGRAKHKGAHINIVVGAPGAGQQQPGADPAQAFKAGVMQGAAMAAKAAQGGGGVMPPAGPPMLPPGGPMAGGMPPRPGMPGMKKGGRVKRGMGGAAVAPTPQAMMPPQQPAAGPRGTQGVMPAPNPAAGAALAKATMPVTAPGATAKQVPVTTAPMPIKPMSPSTGGGASPVAGLMGQLQAMRKRGGRTKRADGGAVGDEKDPQRAAVWKSAFADDYAKSGKTESAWKKGDDAEGAYLRQRDESDMKASGGRIFKEEPGSRPNLPLAKKMKAGALSGEGRLEKAKYYKARGEDR